MTAVGEASNARELLRDSAADVVRSYFELSTLRTLRGGDAAAANDLRSTWRALAALGWTGLLIAEEYGGADATLSDVAVIATELGRALAVTPIVETAVFGAGLISDLGTPEQRRELLPGIADGSSLVIPAHTESARFSTGPFATELLSVDGALRLTGTKTHVTFGQMADVFLVTAQYGDATHVVVVRPDSPGVHVRTGTLIDSRPVAILELRGVPVQPDAVLGDIGAPSPLDDVIARAAVIRAATMAGGASRAFEKTVTYLKDRHQFGVPIGAYQALQHRAAQLHCDVSLAAALVHSAAEAFDQTRSDAQRWAHAAQALASDAYIKAAEEGLQMHGGIGMTDDAEIGFHLKAARVAEFEFGDAEYHRQRFATMAGY